MLTKTELQERRALFAADGAKAMAEYLAEPEAIRVRTAHLKTLRLEQVAVEAAEMQKAVAITKKRKVMKPHKREEPAMLGKRAVDAELGRSLGLSMKDVKPLFAAGGDLAEKKFMECCWCLWKANGSELVEPFVNATFNDLPEKSRAILFQRMLTIVYVAQEIEIKKSIEPVSD